MRTQEKPGPAPAKPAVTTPLKIQVVISRYQGEKKISSLPYTLSVTGGGGGVDRAIAGPAFVGRANLRMGAKIPIASTTLKPAADGNAAVADRSFQYQDVGTNIDCRDLGVETAASASR